MRTKTTTKTRSKSSATTNAGTSYTATQIATFISEAETPGTKAAATRRMNQYVQSRVAEGANQARVESNIRSLVTRLSS